MSEIEGGGLGMLPDRPPPDRPLARRVGEWVHWFGPARLAVTAVSVLAIAVGGFWLVRAPRPPVEAGLPRATTSAGAATSGPASAPATSPATAVASTVVVHVAGAVVAPGVYRLPAGARVDDAVQAAGGALPEAEPDGINLAAILADGMRVYVPHAGEAVTAAASPSASAPTVPAGPVNLNSATVDQLDALPGVGPATAAAIVAHRQANGPFATVDDLADVRGIGPAKLEAIRPLVTV